MEPISLTVDDVTYAQFAVVGRALLYPQNDDVAAAVDVATGLVARA